VVHVSEPHFSFDIVKGFAVVGQHAEKRCTSGAGSAEDKELRLTVSSIARAECGFTYHFARFYLAADIM
jgi:hypothetical protein